MDQLDRSDSGLIVVILEKEGEKLKRPAMQLPHVEFNVSKERLSGRGLSKTLMITMCLCVYK